MRTKNACGENVRAMDPPTLQAQEQIKSLQTLIEQKNKALGTMETLLSEQQEAFAQEKSKDQREIVLLNELVHVFESLFFV